MTRVQAQNPPKEARRWLYAEKCAVGCFELEMLIGEVIEMRNTDPEEDGS